MDANRNTASKTVRRQQGITLVELLVVLFILGLVTTVAVINILPERDKAMVKTARINISTIENALEQYRVDMFSYPTTAQGLEALVEPPPNALRKDDYRPGGYLRNGPPLDPWGRPYQYEFPGEHGVYDLYSYGADGAPGGEGLNADIGNWRED